MQNVIDKIEWMFAGLGGFLGWFFGGFDGFLYALVVFVVCDYFTGVLAAAVKHELSSEVGFKGIAKKVCIFVLVGIANIIDTQILQNGAAIRTAVVFVLLSGKRGSELSRECSSDRSSGAGEAQGDAGTAERRAQSGQNRQAVINREGR